MLQKITSLVAVFMLCVSQQVYSEESTSHQLGQKLMLDLRYFCDDGTAHEQCTTPVTELNEQLAEVLVSAQIGGVILFAENLENISQIVTFVYDMQSLMKAHNLPPLFIAIDQEGGRVARLDDSIATRFVGNMAIGATYSQHKDGFAKSVGRGIARSLKPLGFNVNFAPTVDVNVNPLNPVINVRSYGESPAMVAELGEATVAAMQKEGIMSALKHFPGHGDTHTDSHTGLPRVAHDAATVSRTDVLPFARIISSPTPPAMVMTAHIQYPHLDSTEFKAKDGSMTILPATMSKAILTGLLRDKLKYKGVIVTDALDMAGIAHYFDPASAVIQTFKAGADIALMPFSIRNLQDITAFWEMHRQLMAAVKNNALDKPGLSRSVARIAKLKTHYNVGAFTRAPLETRIAQAQGMLPVSENKALEKQLARAAVTQLYNRNVLPLNADKTWHIIMPDAARCEAMTHALAALLSKTDMTCLNLATLPEGEPYKAWRKGDGVIAMDITPQHSLAEMGGMDDIHRLSGRADKPAQIAWLKTALAYARNNNMPTVFVALRAPYNISEFAGLADAALTTYGYNVTVAPGKPASGAVFNALAAVLAGKQRANGVLPVTVSGLPK